MKKFMVFAVCVFLLTIGTLPVVADEPVVPGSATHVEGDARGVVDYNHGDAITGGFGSGHNFGAYDANGPCDILGQIDLKDVATGTSTPGTNTANSTSSVLTNVKTLTNKASEASGQIGAGFRQGNWAEVGPDDGNFAYAGDNTGGNFDVTQTNPSGDIDLCGVGGAGGSSAVNVAETATSKEAHALTYGGSFVNTSPGVGAREIDGIGAIAAARTLGGTDSPAYAYGGASGLSNYNATTLGPNVSGTVNVSGDILVTHEGNVVTSTVNQKSGAAVIPCGGGTCPQ